jgi:SpoVK/Ycf46/Vps4 family AAA+-type ATPase
MSEPGGTRESRAFSALKELFQGARPLIYICSPEEGRTHDLLREAAQSLFPREIPLWTWSSTKKLCPPDGGQSPTDAATPAGILEFIATHEKAGIFQLKDFHQYMDDADILRRLRDLYETCLDREKFVVITSPLRVLPKELANQLAVVELLQPDIDEMIGFLEDEFKALKKQGHEVPRSKSEMYSIARSLQGLTLDDARHAIRRALVVRQRLDEESLPLLLEEKKLIINRSGLVHYVVDGTEFDHVGGLQYMKKWLSERRKLFLERESLAAEIVPKGILVMGVSGCGKSLSVKAIASCFELPLYRIDMIEVFSGRHGNPDAAFVEACRTVEILAPAVVWFDEIEMGLAGQGDVAATEVGRIFGFFLTWMQEKARGLFVAATANRIDLLPAEMIRKGRFDEVFFIDLPGEDERVEIFNIHLQKRGMDPDQLELNRLKKITLGWTGAEIEQCVVSALTAVKLEDRTVTFDDLHRAALRIIPLSKTMSEQVDHIRSWAYDRALRASPRETIY